MTPRLRAPLKPIPPECLCLAGCGRKRAGNNSRSLCFLCYADPATRALYPRRPSAQGAWADIPQAERDPDTMAEMDALVDARIAEGLPAWWWDEKCEADVEVDQLIRSMARWAARQGREKEMRRQRDHARRVRERQP
jgi:hypothetical protein